MKRSSLPMPRLETPIEPDGMSGARIPAWRLRGVCVCLKPDALDV